MDFLTCSTPTPRSCHVPSPDMLLCDTQRADTKAPHAHASERLISEPLRFPQLTRPQLNGQKGAGAQCELPRSQKPPLAFPFGGMKKSFAFALYSTSSQSSSAFPFTTEGLGGRCSSSSSAGGRRVVQWGGL